MVLGLRCLLIAKWQHRRKGPLYCLRAPETDETCVGMVAV